MPRRLATFAVAALLSVLPSTGARAQHEGDMLIGSTEGGGGAFAVAYDLSTPIVVTKTHSSGGVTVYTSMDPGLASLTAGIPDGLFVLKPDTAVRFLMREIEPPTSGLVLEIDGTTIHDPGESALIGITPEVHVHPIWRLAVLDSEEIADEYHLTFRIIGSNEYRPSVEYQAVIVVDPASRPPTRTPTATVPTPTTTATVPTRTATETPLAVATATTTATTAPLGCPGDCDGNGSVSISELVRAVNIALGSTPPDTCLAADGNSDGRITINELIRAVSSALDGCTPPGLAAALSAAQPAA